MTTVNALERKLIRFLVRKAINLGYSVSVFDGEETNLKRSTKESDIMEAIQSTDEDRLSFFKDGSRIGSAWFIYGNDGYDVMVDCSTGEQFTNELITPYNEYADTFVK